MDNKIIAIVAVIVVAIVAVAAAAVLMGGGEKSSYVTYYGNGGTLAGHDSYQSDSTVCESNDLFTRDGYVCTGYNTKADGTGTRYSEGANVMLGTKLYAQWKVDDESTLVVSTTNINPDKYNLYLGSSSASSVNIDAGFLAHYPLNEGDRIYVQVAGSSGSIGVTSNQMRIDVGDGNIYTLEFTLTNASNVKLTTSGMMAAIDFAFAPGAEVHLSYVLYED